MSKPLVSIITPAYKTAGFIGKTIESVQAQTFTDWELLITDDCSPDNLKEAVAKYVDSDPRVRYFRLSTNSGPAVARNNSIQAAQGNYLAFLDSDDLWHPTKLQRQLSFMNTEGCAFSFTGYQRITEEGVLYRRVNSVPKSVSYQDILTNTSIATLTVMIDRSKVPPVVLRPGWGYDDYVLWLEILKTGTVAKGLNENLANYRVMSSSVSSNKVRALKWVWLIYQKKEKLGFFRSCYCICLFAFNASARRLRARLLD